MWKLVQCHEYITQEGINSQLRAHSILSPFVTCTFYNKLPAKSCIAAYLKVPSMKLLSHRGTDWLYPPNPKKHQYFFFFLSRKDLLWNYCQQKTFSSYKTYGFIFYILLWFHSFPHWGLFNERKKTSFAVSWDCCCLAQKLFRFQNQSPMMILSTPLYPLWTAQGLYTFVFF